MLKRRVVLIITIILLSLGLVTAGLAAASATAGLSRSVQLQELQDPYLELVSELTGMQVLREATGAKCNYDANFGVFLCAPPAPETLPVADLVRKKQALELLQDTGLLLIPDSTNDRVMAFDPSTGDLVDENFIPADPTNLVTPKDAIFTADGEYVLVSDQVNDVVQLYNLDGYYIQIFAPAGGPNPGILDNIIGITLREDGILLVTVTGGANEDSVAEFDQAGNYLTNFIANASGGLDGPFDVYSRAEDWLVSGINSDAIHRYDLNGAYLDNLAAVDNFPEQVSEASNGNVLVANFSGAEEGILEYTPDGDFVGLYNPVGLGGYRGVYELPNGNLLVTNGNGVYEIDRANNLVDTKISGVGGQYIELATYHSEITLAKTVGLDPNSCANSDQLFIPSGNQVTYCYEVFNMGDVTLTLHTLEDSHLGTILSDFPYGLLPGSSAFITQSVVLTEAVVNTATWTAFNPGPGDVVSATDTASVTVYPAACPAGYEQVVVASADFEDFPPYGWTITNTTTDCTGVPEWTNTDPGSRGNLTGGSGSFAIADSDACGSTSVMNTIMTSAPLNFTGLVSPTITFFMDYNDISATGDVANFDVSSDGGLTWQNLFSWNADLRGPLQVGTLLPGEGEDDVRVRWDYQNATWDWWWEVDDVLATACAQFPEIEISPQAVSSTQPANHVVTQTLTLSNLGEALLEWEIAEAGDATGFAGAPMPDKAEIVGREAAPAADIVSDEEVLAAPQVPTYQPGSPFAASPTLLYDNGPLVNCEGCGVGGADESVLQTSLGMNVYGFSHAYHTGFRLADDFTIEDAAGWYIDDLTLFAYQTDSSLTSTIGAINLQIWDGPPDDPGSSVVFGDPLTDRMVESAWSGIYRVTEDNSGVSTNRPIMASRVKVNTFLPQGTYWLDWQAHGEHVSGPYAPPITINGVITTGNALQYTGAWWAAMDVGQQGFPFLIRGCATGEIPWANVVPNDGDVLPGEAADVDVRFDSTGLGVGEYSGSLCVWSNDPDETITSVPLTLTVVLGADLSLTKTASKEPVNPGETFEYTLEVENAGPDPANHTTLLDTLPADVTFISASTGCVIDAEVVICDLGTLAVGEISEVSITVSAPAEEGVIVNLAIVSSDELDMNFVDNRASLETTVMMYRVYLPLATR